MDGFGIAIGIVALILVGAVQAVRRAARGSNSRSPDIFTLSKSRNEFVDDLTLINGRNTWDPSHPMYHDDV